MWGKRENILYKAANIERLARNLQKEALGWLPSNHARPNWIETRGFEQINHVKRSNVIWFNATEAGVEIFELCGLGAFDDEPRIMNMVCQTRSELESLLRKFSLPHPHMAVHSGYSLRTGRTLDIFFVKIFE